MRAGDHRPKLVLEGGAHEGEGAHRLAVEASPEAHHLVLASERLGETKRALHCLGSTRVKLYAMDAWRRRVRREALDELHASAAREGPDGCGHHLIADGTDHLRVRVTQRVHTDAADDVEERIAVDVGDGAAERGFDGHSGLDRVALEPRRDVRVLSSTQGNALRPGHERLQVDLLILGVRRRANGGGVHRAWVRRAGQTTGGRADGLCGKTK